MISAGAVSQVWMLSGAALAAAWLWRTVEAAIGMRTIPDITAQRYDRVPASSPRISIIVPARNEAESLERCLRTLLALEYPELEIIVVNDRSTDATGDIAQQVASSPDARQRLRVLNVTQLPPRWLGKTHAMWLAASQASGEWLLFTDGDIFFRADCLRRLMVYQESAAADHLVVYPTMLMRTVGECMMIGFFQNMLIFGIRLWKVSDPTARDFVGAGAFNMIRRSAYEKIGTYQAMRLAVVDDLALGKAVKENGLSQHFVLGDGLISVRWAKSAIGVVRNLTKNTFAMMNYRVSWVCGAAVGVALLTLAPLAGVILAPGAAKIGFAVSILALAAVYKIMAPVTKVPAIYFFTFPLATLLAIYTLLRSTAVTLWQGGVSWRGTLYSLDELRSKE